MVKMVQCSGLAGRCVAVHGVDGYGVKVSGVADRSGADRGGADLVLFT